MANFNLNKAIIGGRLTTDPELRQTSTGVMVTTFTVAVNRRFASKNEDGSQQIQADFIRVTAWRQQAEFVSKYFAKGSSICIIGSIQTRSWTDQQGNKQYSTEVLADEINFVDSRGEASTTPIAATGISDMTVPDDIPKDGYIPMSYRPGATNTNTITQPQFDVVSDDDLPF